MENMGEITADSQEPWPEQFTTALSTFLSAEKILDVKRIYLEGLSATPTEPSNASRNKGRRQKASEGAQDDNSKVISDVSSVLPFHNIVLKPCQPISSKETRKALHHAVRHLFKGKLDSETDTSSVGEGSCIVIRWARQGRGGRGAFIVKIVLPVLTRSNPRRITGCISTIHSFHPSKDESRYARRAGAPFSSSACQRERSFRRWYQGQARSDSSACIFQTWKQDGRRRVENNKWYQPPKTC